MFSAEFRNDAEKILDEARAKGLMITTAESCTGGLIAACLTEIAGSSDVMDCGFVTYSNAAKTHMLGVSPALLEMHGAVSEPVAIAMAEGALEQSLAGISIAVTGIAGPSGGSEDKPVGLVHIAGATKAGRIISERYQFGAIGRSNVRKETVRAAFTILHRLIAGNREDRT